MCIWADDITKGTAISILEILYHRNFWHISKLFSCMSLNLTLIKNLRMLQRICSGLGFFLPCYFPQKWWQRYKMYCRATFVRHFNVRPIIFHVCWLEPKSKQFSVPVKTQKAPILLDFLSSCIKSTCCTFFAHLVWQPKQQLDKLRFHLFARKRD